MENDAESCGRPSGFFVARRMALRVAGGKAMNVRLALSRCFGGWRSWRCWAATSLVLVTALAGMLLVQYRRLHHEEAHRLRRVADGAAEIVGKQLAVAERQLLEVAEICRKAQPRCGDTGSSMPPGVLTFGEGGHSNSPIDLVGRVRLAGRSEVLGQNVRASAAYRAALPQEARRSVLWRDDTAGSVLGLARVVADSRGELVGVAAVEQIGEDLGERLQALRYATDVQLVVGEVGGRMWVVVPPRDAQALASLFPRGLLPADGEAGEGVLLQSGVADAQGHDTWVALRSVGLGTVSSARPWVVGVARSRSAIDALWWEDVFVAGALLVVAFLASAVPRACHVWLERRRVSGRAAVEASGLGAHGRLTAGERLTLLGALAGGFAHDFNNLLVAVLGFSGLGKVMARAASGSERLLGYFQEIETAGERGRALVQQILAISRGTEDPLALISVPEVVQEVIDGLAPTFFEGTRLSASGTESLPRLAVEREHLHRMLANLCRNARDALGESGSVLVAAHTIRVDPAMLCASCGRTFVGDFVRIAVIDQGHGIPAEIRDRVFEAFFTTRETASGCGTGLTVVHGLLHYYGGHAQLVSTPGRGTEVALLLPIPQGLVDGSR